MPPFNLIFLGLGWPWVGELVRRFHNNIYIRFPTQEDLVYCISQTRYFYAPCLVLITACVSRKNSHHLLPCKYCCALILHGIIGPPMFSFFGRCTSSRYRVTKLWSRMKTWGIWEYSVTSVLLIYSVVDQRFSSFKRVFFETAVHMGRGGCTHCHARP